MISVADALSIEKQERPGELGRLTRFFALSVSLVVRALQRGFHSTWLELNRAAFK